MKGNCNECKHGITTWSDNNLELEKQGYSKVSYKSQSSGEMMVKCDIDNDEKNLKWWNGNGKKTKDITEMECYEPTLLHVKSKSIMGKLDQMINIIDKYNNNANK